MLHCPFQPAKDPSVSVRGKACILPRWYSMVWSSPGGGTEESPFLLCLPFLHAPFISITGDFNNPPISGGLKSPSVLSCGPLVIDPPRGDSEAQVCSVCSSVNSQCAEPRQRKRIVPSVGNECVVYLLAFITVCCRVLLSSGSSASSRRKSYVPWQPTCQLTHQSHNSSLLLWAPGQKEKVG